MSITMFGFWLSPNNGEGDMSPKTIRSPLAIPLALSLHFIAAPLHFYSIFFRVVMVILTHLSRLAVRNADREAGASIDFDHHFTINTKSRELSPATVGQCFFDIE
jgi:hypothetical protein